MATYRKVKTSILIIETVAVIIIIIAIAIHPLHARIILGVENFVNNKYNELSNSKRVGIIANPTSLLPKTLNHIVDVMHDDMLQGNLKVEELIVFGPEHGFRGAAEAGHVGIENAHGPGPSGDPYMDGNIKLCEISVKPLLSR